MSPTEETPTARSAPVALVTGASRNIGRAIARALARDGFHVACFARSADDLAETVKLIEQDGGTATSHPGDATNEGDLRSVVGAISAAHGGLDLLVNNAGIIHDTPSSDLDPADFRRVLEVNLVAYFTLAAASHGLLRNSPRRLELKG